MSKKRTLITLFPIMVILLTACGTDLMLANPTANEGSCAQPVPEKVVYCQQIEQSILAATVRLELFRWSEVDGRKGEFIAGGNSHATIKDGRYLVTHNHFGELLEALRHQGLPGEYIRMAMYKTNGELLLSNIPLEDLTVVFEDEQTLVLSLKDLGSMGFFEMHGLPSAEFASWQELPLQAGTEVAQVDWDGQTSFVQWTTIDHLLTSGGTPQISLKSYVKQGSSGGGVFWNGVHIGNNWYRVSEQNQETGEVLAQYSMVALNSVQVTAVVLSPENLAQRPTSPNTNYNNLNADNLVDENIQNAY